ncbi:hypothetical protein RFI_25967 [Reticulomyxa filosa]|uniref:Uncharacterized protein n=1 Tax=Reticulomyxa filosa TaxID=46433 RepID=X6MC41_RETFI|nr:hypothetical protein RFI_25967 [Reticulomyxa filosa]|eukprot:ETO11409.1 hypothetical protein RFI_25967 [Reticulomyxa filosa]
MCSGSYDQTIRILDIETTKQLNIFKGHSNYVRTVKYGPNILLNLILSGSYDNSVRLWDIRSGQQIQLFNGHLNTISSVEYSPFTTKNNIGNSNVICSGSFDNTIRFWDIRSNKNELYLIKGHNPYYGITCVKFIKLKKVDIYDWSLCYSATNGPLYIYILARKVSDFFFFQKSFFIFLSLIFHNAIVTMKKYKLGITWLHYSNIMHAISS